MTLLLAWLAAVGAPVLAAILGWKYGYRAGRSDGYNAGRADARAGRPA